MSGKAAQQSTMLMAVTPDVIMARRYPIRLIKSMVDEPLTQLSTSFDRIHASNGRT